MDFQKLSNRYANITKKLIDMELTLSTMESCTSGLIASLITDVEGSSKVLQGAFVTYSNQAKVQNGVSMSIVNEFGIYSKETAAEMAWACKRQYRADIGIGITGTCGNVDENNADSEAGVIYYCINYESEYHFHLVLPTMNSRLEYKMEIANQIAEALELLLGIK